MRIGTRKSTMALAQTEEIARQLRAAWPDLPVEIVKFDTRGDDDQVSKLLRHGGKGGAFVAEIRAAVRRGELQAAMHSLKDMPGNEETPGLVIGAMLARDPPGDALVVRPGVTIGEIRNAKGRGYKIGTNSVRRASYLRRLFPEVEVIHFRGAADTRVRKLDTGQLQQMPDGSARGPADALVMARSGLERVGLAGRIVHDFSPAEMLPAVGQGIVAVECGEADWTTRRPSRAHQRCGVARMRRCRARGALGAQRSLQFADCRTRYDRRRRHDAASRGDRGGRQPLYRGRAHRPGGAAARTRPHGRAGSAANVAQPKSSSGRGLSTEPACAACMPSHQDGDFAATRRAGARGAASARHARSASRAECRGRD